ncbi:MAG TPA: CARDB domain-containing protein [Thermoplasmata archaeon]|nr:CARDB domain-containing protein [Thermoplasmata archaeon]
MAGLVAVSVLLGLVVVAPQSGGGSWSCGGTSYVSDPFSEVIVNGGFEQDFAGWYAATPGAQLFPTLSPTIVHSGRQAARVDADPGNPNHAEQNGTFRSTLAVYSFWFYAETWGPGGVFVSEILANWTPSAGTAEFVTGVSIFPSNVQWSVWRSFRGTGVVQTLPVAIDAGRWHSLEIVMDRARGIQCLYVDGSPLGAATINPADAFEGNVVLFGDASQLGDAGVAYYDDESLLALNPALPDYVPTNPAPTGALRVGESVPVNFSLEVQNRANVSANEAATVAFYNESTPGTPFSSFAIPPLSAGAATGPFTATWLSPAIPETYRVIADVDYGNDVAESEEGNNLYVWNVTVVPGPVTTLSMGAPHFGTFVTSSTPLALSVQDTGGSGIARTRYRVDAGGWQDYVGPFTLTTEGDRLVEWFSTDNAMNVETVQNATLTVDDTPPTTISAVGTPKFNAFVTSSTRVSLSAVDGGPHAVGVGYLAYSLDETDWIPYDAPFFLAGADGPKTVSYRATDLLGNVELIRQLLLVLDNTPPTTTLGVPAGPLALDSAFDLASHDGGSGVAQIEFRVDGGSWRPYESPFVLSVGAHVVAYRATDRLGNQEPERTAAVTIVNWKPIVAFLFALVLAFFGLALAWGARRSAPSADGWKAVLAVAIAFAAAEAVTGLVSALTGALAIPPLLGLGTLVDVAILAAGLVITVLLNRRARRKAGPGAQAPEA